MSRNVIAIDGPAGSGKSSVARALASALGWSFLDTGAMYRAITVEALATGVALEDHEALGELARAVRVTTLPRVNVNGRDVEHEIRTELVNVSVSVVAANPLVRGEMVVRQREFARAQPRGTVVEGRDITTVVFPDAMLKVYLTASLAERTRRRDDESEASVSRRDEADVSRDASPLRVADDAIVLDTTEHTVEGAVKEIMTWLNRKISS